MASSTDSHDARPTLLKLVAPGPSAGDASAMRPHILLAVDQLSRTLGGGERILLRLAKLLPAYGYRVTVLTLSAETEDADWLASAPCPIYLLPLKRTFGSEAIDAARALRLFIREQQVQLVQTFFESSDLWVGPVAKVLGRTRLIWSRRDMGILRGRKHRIAYRLLARLPDMVFAVSEQVRRYSIEVDGIPPDRVETLYNGLDLSDWLVSQKPYTKSNLTIIKTVGNIRRVKGHDVLIQAAALIAHEYPAVRFHIGGANLDPEFCSELESLIKELHLQDRVRFDGSVNDIHSYLTDADMFVLPSRSEGFSNAIIEGMAAGLPVIATDVGGNAEAVEDRVTGRIVPPEDVQALTQAMRDLLSNPELMRGMGRAGRDRVSERFTTEAMMRQLVRAYQRLLGRVAE